MCAEAVIELVGLGRQRIGPSAGVVFTGVCKERDGGGSCNAERGV